VHEVVGHREPEVAANRSRCRLRRIGRAHGRAHNRHRRLALDHQGKRWAGGDEGDQPGEEVLATMLGVVSVGQLLVDLNQLGAA